MLTFRPPQYQRLRGHLQLLRRQQPGESKGLCGGVARRVRDLDQEDVTGAAVVDSFGALESAEDQQLEEHRVDACGHNMADIQVKSEGELFPQTADSRQQTAEGHKSVISI